MRLGGLASPAVKTKTLLKFVLVVGGFALVCALAVAFRMYRVNEQTGEWRMRPDADPPILYVDGHLYRRTHRVPARLPWLHATSKDTDLGGGLLLLPTSSTDTAPAIIQVRTHERFYDYRLAG